jgi:hypothetical protein
VAVKTKVNNNPWIGEPFTVEADGQNWEDVASVKLNYPTDDRARIEAAGTRVFRFYVQQQKSHHIQKPVVNVTVTSLVKSDGQPLGCALSYDADDSDPYISWRVEESKPGPIDRKPMTEEDEKRIHAATEEMFKNAPRDKDGKISLTK